MKDSGKLIWFYKALKKYSDFFMNYSFVLSKKVIKKSSCEVLFTNEDLYIKFYASVHPRDYEPFFNIVLGKGSNEYPDADWNGIPLWRLKNHKSPQTQASEYPLSMVDIDKQLEIALNDLKDYGEDFLRRDLKWFYKTLKLQNANREPYIINIPADEGFISTQDWESKDLKRKHTK